MTDDMRHVIYLNKVLTMVQDSILKPAEEPKVQEYECQECYELKDGTHFRLHADVCDECKEETRRSEAESKDDRDDLRGDR